MSNEKRNVTEKENPQVEDRVFKFASMYFGEELLQYLEIYEQVCAAAPSEVIHLELKQMYQDFNYVTKEGGWLHFEFVSGYISKKDLRKFRRYESVTSYAYDVPVTTYVVYTGGTKKPRRVLKDGINTYRVNLVQLTDKDVDKFFEELKRKQEQKQVTKTDLVAAVLTPLMAGEMSVKQRIMNSLEFLRTHMNEVDEDEYQRMTAMLYALATKFLNDGDMKDVGEVLSMTVLGEMLMEKGMEKGQYLRLIKIIVKKVRRGQSAAEIAEDLVEELDVVMPVYTVTILNPEYDENEIYNELIK